MYASLAIGIILSGGPYSVYESDAPSIPPAVFELEVPILGKTSPTHGSLFEQVVSTETMFGCSRTAPRRITLT